MAGPSSTGDQFQRWFAYEALSNVVLDFDTVGPDGKPLTHEGRIKRHILRETKQSSLVVAIHGPGGVGKSTILKGLMNDDDVRNAFSDGMHQISLGMNATPATLLQQLSSVLRNAGAVVMADKLYAENNVESAIRDVISWFRGKSCIFLIDDVWTSDIAIGLISRLCKLGDQEQQSTVVLTTREHHVASLAPQEGMFLVAPREPQGRESQRILFCHADVTDKELSEHSTDTPLREVLNICSGLPVCLAAAGKGAKMLMADAQNTKENPWSEYLLSLSNYREQLLEQKVTDYGNLYATFTASLALLDKERKQTPRLETPLSFSEMYRRLCVLQKQAKAPAIMLRHLWKLNNPVEAITVAEQMEKVGLAELGYQRVGDNQVWYLRVHDSLHDFAVSEAKRHGDTVHAHEVLLNGYSESHPKLTTEIDRSTLWWSRRLKDDDYIHKNLCRHLRCSGKVEELVALLETPWWIRRQLEVNDIWTLDNDFMIGISAVLQASQGYRSEDETVLRLIREALMLSFGFIYKNLQETWFQLYGRLLGHRDRCERIRDFLLRMESDPNERWLRSINSFLEGPGSSTIRMIPADPDVLCMAVLKGTDNIACGCGDGKIVVVDVMRGTVEKTWLGHSTKVCAIASGKRGTRIITGGQDKDVSVWNTDTGDCVLTFLGHSGRVNSVVTLADGQRVASASEDGTLQVWDMQTGLTLATFLADAPVRRIAAFPDAELLVSGGADATLRVWDLKNGLQIEDPLPGYNVFMNYVAVTPDGGRILSGSCDEALRAHSAKPLEKIGDVNAVEVLIELDTGVECVALSGDGKYIVSGHANGKIRLWDATSGNPIGSTLQGHTARVRDITFLESSDVVVSASSDGHIRVWDVARMTELSQPPQEGRISKVVFTPSGDQVITGSLDGSLRIWDTTSGQQLGGLLGHAGPVSDLALTPDGSRMVSVCNEKDMSVRVWDVHSQSMITELGNHRGWISSVAITPNGDHAIAGSLDKSVYIWYLNAVVEDDFFFVLRGHTEWVLKVYVSHDGKRIISVGDNIEVLVWDIATRNCVKIFTIREPWNKSRETIMRIVRESPGRARTDVLQSDREEDESDEISVDGRQILYGKNQTVLGTMECEIKSEASFPHRNTFCIGLRDGQIALMKLETPSKED